MTKDAKDSVFWVVVERLVQVLAGCPISTKKYVMMNRTEYHIELYLSVTVMASRCISCLSGRLHGVGPVLRKSAHGT